MAEATEVRAGTRIIAIKAANDGAQVLDKHGFDRLVGEDTGPSPAAR